ncbi:hypothetical protein HYH03_006928 [Edaphochlamys debaryana]|uniref:Uncharacterized protein n=1 Tax=Edaphochlamys debaryana TaxID=47281 RepID=A0A836BZT2_9CHLO|nr:hypothetical protein HYH03_006928 [Edaphochlamys debaryana]|eukprot:KAG2494995.1 hypothetical protein HYH03_006928 [Edaphochlamys debaryana]
MASDAAVEAVGGAVGSVLSLLATYPLAVVSTWQALEHQKGSEGGTSELRLKYAHLPSPIKELLVYSEERGWPALFAGLRPCLAATAVSNLVYFYIYSALRQAVVARQQGSSPLPPGASSRTQAISVGASLLVAGLAGCGNVLVTNPVWVVSTQLQAAGRSPDPLVRGRGAWQVALQLHKEAGVGGFWRGVLPSLVMVANPTLQYILYEWLTGKLLGMRRSAARGKAAARLGPGDVFLLTALAKLGATLVTYPMLLIKSRLQAMNSSTAHEARYSGVLDAVAAILRREGLAAFFKGMRLKMVQTVLAAALLMAIKEQVYVSTRAVIGAGPSRPGPVAVAATAPAARS